MTAGTIYTNTLSGSSGSFNYLTTDTLTAGTIYTNIINGSSGSFNYLTGGTASFKYLSVDTLTGNNISGNTIITSSITCTGSNSYTNITSSYLKLFNGNNNITADINRVSCTINISNVDLLSSSAPGQCIIFTTPIKNEWLSGIASVSDNNYNVTIAFNSGVTPLPTSTPFNIIGTYFWALTNTSYTKWQPYQTYIPISTPKKINNSGTVNIISWGTTYQLIPSSFTSTGLQMPSDTNTYQYLSLVVECYFSDTTPGGGAANANLYKATSNTPFKSDSSQKLTFSVAVPNKTVGIDGYNGIISTNTINGGTASFNYINGSSGSFNYLSANTLTAGTIYTNTITGSSGSFNYLLLNDTSTQGISVDPSRIKVYDNSKTKPVTAIIYSNSGNIQSIGSIQSTVGDINGAGSTIAPYTEMTNTSINLCVADDTNGSAISSITMATSNGSISFYDTVSTHLAYKQSSCSIKMGSERVIDICNNRTNASIPTLTLAGDYNGSGKVLVKKYNTTSNSADDVIVIDGDSKTIQVKDEVNAKIGTSVIPSGINMYNSSGNNTAQLQNYTTGYGELYLNNSSGHPNIHLSGYDGSATFMNQYVTLNNNSVGVNYLTFYNKGCINIYSSQPGSTDVPLLTIDTSSGYGCISLYKSLSPNIILNSSEGEIYTNIIRPLNDNDDISIGSPSPSVSNRYFVKFSPSVGIMKFYYHDETGSHETINITTNSNKVGAITMGNGSTTDPCVTLNSSGLQLNDNNNKLRIQLYAIDGVVYLKNTNGTNGTNTITMTSSSGSIEASTISLTGGVTTQSLTVNGDTNCTGNMSVGGYITSVGVDTGTLNVTEITSRSTSDHITIGGYPQTGNTTYFCQHKNTTNKLTFYNSKTSDADTNATVVLDGLNGDINCIRNMSVGGYIAFPYMYINRPIILPISTENNITISYPVNDTYFLGTFSSDYTITFPDADLAHFGTKMTFIQSYKSDYYIKFQSSQIFIDSYGSSNNTANSTSGLYNNNTRNGSPYNIFTPNLNNNNNIIRVTFMAVPTTTSYSEWGWVQCY